MFEGEPYARGGEWCTGVEQQRELEGLKVGARRDCLKIESLLTLDCLKSMRTNTHVCAEAVMGAVVGARSAAIGAALAQRFPL